MTLNTNRPRSRLSQWVFAIALAYFTLLGTSLPALLFWPALAGALRIILTAAFARETRCWGKELAVST